MTVKPIGAAQQSKRTSAWDAIMSAMDALPLTLERNAPLVKRDVKTRETIPAADEKQIREYLATLQRKAHTAELLLLKRLRSMKGDRARGLRAYATLCAVEQEKDQRLPIAVKEAILRGVVLPRTNSLLGANGILGIIDAQILGGLLLESPAKDGLQRLVEAVAANAPDPEAAITAQSLLLKSIATRAPALRYSAAEQYLEQIGFPRGKSSAQVELETIEQFVQEIAGEEKEQLLRRSTVLDFFDREEVRRGERPCHEVRITLTNGCTGHAALVARALSDPIFARALTETPYPFAHNTSPFADLRAEARYRQELSRIAAKYGGDQRTVLGNILRHRLITTIDRLPLRDATVLRRHIAGKETSPSALRRSIAALGQVVGRERCLGLDLEEALEEIRHNALHQPRSLLKPSVVLTDYVPYRRFAKRSNFHGGREAARIEQERIDRARGGVILVFDAADQSVHVLRVEKKGQEYQVGDRRASFDELWQHPERFLDLKQPYTFMPKTAQNLPAVTESLEQGLSVILTVNDAKDPESGHVVLLAGTRETASGRYFLLLDGEAKESMQWVLEEEIVSGAFIQRLHPDYQVPYISHIYLEEPRDDVE